ncbi:hypothetical protein [Streptomyces sp. NPDC005898]|uniref:hypothetical protein n=1 Tax=Streptomyces sp. NPDC005898 TaxID=3157082 RepID=UPI0033CCDEC6
MDAGLAAVCGALAGSLGTIGASFAAGWWQRESAQMAVRADHKKEQRQPRYDAYKAFSSACAELAEISRSHGTEDEAFQIARTLENEVKAQWVEISLLGPAYVLEPANALRASSLSITSTMYRASRAGSTEDGDSPESRQRITDEVYESFAQLDSAADAVYRDLEIFASAAQQSIEDDGSRNKDRPR